MSPLHSRRDFLKEASLLPLCATGALAFAGTAAAQTPIARTGGPRLKLSLNAYSFAPLLEAHLQQRGPGISLLELLDFCAEHEFDAIDPTGYFFPGYPAVPEADFLNAFKRRAFQLGIDISGTGVRNDFANPDAAKRAADVQLVKAWIETAARMGAPVLRVFAGPVPAGYENRWDEVTAWMVEALRECVEYARRFGVLIGVQNHGDMLQTADQTLAVVRLVASDWFGVIVDTGSFLTDDPYADIARVVPHAVNWQVKESPFGKDSPVRTDLPRLLQIIRAGGYRGYLPIETLAATGRPYDPRVLAAQFGREMRAAISAAE